jgi:hypothetical protein
VIWRRRSRSRSSRSSATVDLAVSRSISLERSSRAPSSLAAEARSAELSSAEVHRGRALADPARARAAPDRALACPASLALPGRGELGGGPEAPARRRGEAACAD